MKEKVQADKLNFERRQGMKIAGFLLYAVGICFCIAGFLGHSAAWAAAALSFFAATMIIVRQQKNKGTKQ